MTTQTAVSSGEVCRLTVYGPQSRVELAVPAHVPVADLLPTFLGHLGPELALTGLDHGGWVLQRMGEPPLEEDLGTAALGLLDGDMVFLRPRSDQLPPVDFDDLVDGVASGIAERKDAWRPEHTRRLALACVAFVLAVSLLLVPTLGSGVVVALVAGTTAVLLVLATIAAVRAYGDHAAGAVFGYAAVGFAALAGFALPQVEAGLSMAAAMSSPALLAAGAFVTTTALAAQAGSGGMRPGLLSVTVVAALTGAAGLLAATTTLNGADAAAVVLPFALLGGYLTPGLAARMAGLKIPPLPQNPEEFQQDVDPVPSGQLLARTAAADAYATALHLGLAAVSTGCLLLLAPEPGRTAPLLVLTTALLVLLHSRELIGARQRIAMLAPGVLGPAALLLVECRQRTPEFRFVVLALLLLVALLFAVAARKLPGHKLLPHWGLAGDISHWLAAAAIVPLALAVAGVYARVRGLWS